MSDPEVVISLISGGAVVLAALIAAIATIISSRNERRELRNRIEVVAEDARIVKHQTQNTHDTNLRDDLDMVLRTVARVEDNQHETRRDVARLHHDLRDLRRHVDESDGNDEKVHRNIFERLASLTNPKDTEL